MKKISIIFLTMVLFCAFNFLIVSTASADFLKWDHSGECVDGYKIYYGYNDVFESVDAGNVLIYDLNQLELVPCKKYTMYVVAYNPAGESEPSNIAYCVRVVDPPGVPQNVRIEYNDN